MLPLLLLGVLSALPAGGRGAAPPITPDAVRTVHVVASNHLDVGFADFAPRIMNRCAKKEEEEEEEEGEAQELEEEGGEQELEQEGGEQEGEAEEGHNP